MRLWLWYVAGEMQQQLNWSSRQRQMVLGAFLPGFILMQVVAGWLASRFGGKRVMTVGVAISMVCSIILPVAAKNHRLGLLLAVRIFSGVGEGMCGPAFNAMLGRWAPPLERSTMSAIAYSGCYAGAMVAALLSRVAVGADSFEWPAMSYLLAASSLVWLVSWNIFGHAGPDRHPTISADERSHIIRTVAKKQLGHGFQPVPWRRIIASSALWSVIAAHVGSDAIFYLLLWSGHAFLTDIYGVDFNYHDDRTGVVASALPWVAMVLFAVGSATFADRLRFSGMETTKVRKLFTASSLVAGAAILVLMGYLKGNAQVLSADYIDVGVVLTCFLHATVGIGFGGWRVNHLDLGPRYAGVLLAVTTTISTLVGVATPFISDHYVACARCANATNPCNGLYFINAGERSSVGSGNHSGSGGGSGGGSAGTGTSNACPTFHSSYRSEAKGFSATTAAAAAVLDAFGPGEGSGTVKSAPAMAATADNCTFGANTTNPYFASCTMDESHNAWRHVFWWPVGFALLGAVGFLLGGSGDVQEWNSPSFRGLIHKASKAQWKSILSE